jgi:hypothetical protein
MSEAQEPRSKAEREGIVDQQDAVIERMQQLDEQAEADGDSKEDDPTAE